MSKKYLFQLKIFFHSDLEWLLWNPRVLSIFEEEIFDKIRRICTIPNLSKIEHLNVSFSAMCHIYCSHILNPELCSPFSLMQNILFLIDIIVQCYLVAGHPNTTIPSDEKINITSSPTLTLLSVYPRTLINRKHNILMFARAHWPIL